MLRCPTRCGSFAALLLFFALGGLLSGCESDRRTQGLAPAKTSAEMQVVATVNQEPISLETFRQYYETERIRLRSLLSESEEEERVLREILLEDLIEKKLLDQEAQRLGIQVSEEELRSHYAQFTLQAAALGHTAADRPWIEALRQRIVQRKLIEHVLLPRIVIAEETLLEHYRQHRQEFHRPEEIHARHIVVRTRADYDRLRKRIAKRESFADLAETYSIVSAPYPGGSLGYVSRGMLPAALEKALFALQRKGSVTRKPLQSVSGYHLFQLVHRRKAGIPPYAEVKPQIRRQLAESQQPVEYRRWMQGLRDRARIQIYTERLKGLRIPR